MDQKISLEDLKNGVEPQEEQKEEVNYQAMVAAEAAANAQAYKERVLKERAEKAKAEEEQAKAEQEKAHKEHMEKVFTGDEAPDTTQEYFDGILHNIERTMERKQYEKDLVDNHFAEVAAQEEEDKEVEEMRASYLSRRNFLVKTFNDMGLHTFNPMGAFYVFPCIRSTGLTSEEFCEELLNDQKVACVPGTAFGDAGEGFIRVSYAYSLEELKIATEKIKLFLDNLKNRSH